MVRLFGIQPEDSNDAAFLQAFLSKMADPYLLLKRTISVWVIKLDVSLLASLQHALPMYFFQRGSVYQFSRRAFGV